VARCDKCNDGGDSDPDPDGDSDGAAMEPRNALSSHTPVTNRLPSPVDHVLTRSSRKCKVFDIETEVRMRTLVLGAMVCLLSGFAFTQDLLSELAGPAEAYKTAVEALEKQRLSDMAQAARTYVSVLDGIEKSATAKGEVKIVEAAARERKAALAGRLAAELPAELPALRLQGSRRALLMKQEKVNVDAAGRKKRLDSQYLGVLASLAAKAEPGSTLGKQVAAEREAVLAAGKEGAGGGKASGGEAKASQVPRGKNVVVNGDFEKVDALGKPEGWLFHGPVSVEKEERNTFVRIKGGTVAGGYYRQEMERPNNVTHGTIRAKLRTHGRIGLDRSRGSANISCKNK
jgi:hypothetical protein